MSDEVTEFPTKLNSLPPEVRAEKREKLRLRKAFAAVSSAFVKAMQDCMRAYQEARAQGVERADAAKGIELVLRDTWLRATTKFPPRCEGCEDTGWEEDICRPYARCQRDTCQRKGDEFQHRYVRICACPSGERFTKKAPAPEVTVGKVQKSAKGWRQIGT